MSARLEMLAAAERDASGAVWSIKRELDEAVADARRPHIQAAGEAETAVRLSYAERVAAANDAHRAATEAHDAAKIEAAESGEGLPYPLGTVVVKWENPSCYGNTFPHRATDERARLEVFKTGDEYPLNRGSYSRPDPGQLVLRLLKKNGTPGINVLRFGNDMATYWLPEGVAHASAAQASK